jgi:hypothetical protein
MSKSLNTLVLTAAASVSIIVGAAGTADATPSVRASRESACQYRYVVTDGKPNNVTTYKGPRGTATQSTIRPNGRFIVFSAAGDRIGGRQRTDHGWVSFPRSYLRPTGPCATALSQAAAETATLIKVANQAFGDIGRSLGNSAHSPR